MRKPITTDKAPQAIGPYSQAIAAGQLLFLSGQTPLDPATGKLVDGGITEQTHRVMQNLAAVLLAAGASTDNRKPFENVVRMTIFLADMNDFAAVNKVYGSYIENPAPARACVQVAELPMKARVEIDAIAALS